MLLHRREEDIDTDEYSDAPLTAFHLTEDSYKIAVKLSTVTLSPSLVFRFSLKIDTKERWNAIVVGDYCWSIQNKTDVSIHARKAHKIKFFS